MNKVWKKIRSKKVFECYKFKVFEDDVIMPDGNQGKYFLIERLSSVAIIPFDGKKIYLVNQYRYTIKKRSWQLPAGRAENKNYLFQAKKELREETGIKASKWHYLGQFFPSVGSSSHIGKIYLAEKLEFGKPELEPSESDMHMKGFTLEQIDQMVKNGSIDDGWVMVCLYYFRLFKKL